ncbi:MAG: exodeoxyribonuclease VII large subunit [Rickettsiales bacterium]|nr:exodeoxyribonuclease VII large subunit [Rickettsiales bacterium]
MTLPPNSHNQPEYTVSGISNAIKADIDQKYSFVRIRGEISGLKKAPSGHLYLSLKDDKSVLKAVCWKGVASNFSVTPEDGMEVICTGKITTYAAQSTYQLVIEKIEVSGTGALMALLEKRKIQLAKEGLFDVERKQALPQFPERIGIITSPTGAVIQDILHRIGERYPTHVMLWPVLVQGNQAAEQITDAINGFNQMSDNESRPDVLIVARGGGSIEDLWCFNEEIVVRAAANSAIPLVSAVGHETDTTLIDYASDKRAPTPTAAAEITTPVRSDILHYLNNASSALQQQMQSKLDYYTQRIDDLSRGIISPTTYVERCDERLTHITHLMKRNVTELLLNKQYHVDMLGNRLVSPVHTIDTSRNTVDMLTQRMEFAMKRIIEHKETHIDSFERLLHNLDYKNVLRRGYSIVRNGQKEIVTSQDELSHTSHIYVELHDGISNKIALKSRKKQSDTSLQHDLFTE